MKTKTIAFLVIAAVVMSAVAVGTVMAEKKVKCATIQGGTINASTGEPLTTGYDQWGYNYQAHMFNGPLAYYDRHYDPDDPDWNDEFIDVDLMMKWNDAWLSNMDCDDDEKLDRHYGYDSYIGSGAWLTNHEFGTYELDGETCSYTYFCKIVAAPADAYAEGGVWYEADGTVIGPVIWGAFATIQEVVNDPCADLHGLQYLSPASAGFGYYKP